MTSNPTMPRYSNDNTPHPFTPSAMFWFSMGGAALVWLWLWFLASATYPIWGDPPGGPLSEQSGAYILGHLVGLAVLFLVPLSLTLWWKASFSRYDTGTVSRPVMMILVIAVGLILSSGAFWLLLAAMV